jgi:hypothetical protein
LQPAFLRTASVIVSLAKSKSKRFKSSIFAGDKSSSPIEAPHKMSFLPAFFISLSKV